MAQTGSIPQLGGDHGFIQHGLPIHGANKKLSKTEVFARISQIMCSVVSSVGEGSGFLLNANGDVLTVGHHIPFVNGFMVEYVQVKHEQSEDPHFPQAPEMIPENVSILDLFVLKTHIPSATIPLLPLLPKDFTLQV